MIADLFVSLPSDDEHFPVQVAYNARQALALAARDFPPVTDLLDVSLPGPRMS